MSEFPVRVAIVASDDILRLDDSMQVAPGAGNLSRVRSDGSVVWCVSPDDYSQDAWTSVEVVSADVCRAFTWEGWSVDLDLATGAELARTFAK